MKRICVALVFASLSASAWGHEGHQPLPTKGVQVDAKRGRITLSKPAREVLDVQTVQVEQRESSERLRAYASIVAPWNNDAVVTSRLPGRVVALHVRPGDSVEAGQVLAEIDSLALHALRLEYQQARNDVGLSEQILAGLEPAATAGAVSGQKLIDAQRDHRQNLNTLQVLRAKAAALQVEEAVLEAGEASRPLRLPIQSLIGGVVAHADLAVGKFIEPNEHLMDIVDLSTVWVRIGVLERDWHRVAMGQDAKLSVDALPGRVFGAKIDRLGSLLDPETHQGIAWAELRNNDKSLAVRPGMSGQAELSWPNPKATLSVPNQAVFSDGAERFVLVEEAATKSGSEYQRVAVVVGRQSVGRTEIVAGKLLPGDRVVTRGGHELAGLFFLGVLRISPETARTIGLEVEPVARQVVEQTLSLDGALDVPPQRRTTASSQLSGKLVKIRVDRGQTVAAGETLAEIASLELQDTQLELLRQHLDGQLWRGALDRLRGVVGSLPRRVLLETEGRARTVETKLASLRQQLLTLGLTSEQIDGVLQSNRVIEMLPVRAPIDGAVVDLNRRLGQVVRADESLFEIHDLSHVWVQAFVSQRDSARVQVGQSARVRLVAYPDVEFAGAVSRLGPIIGAESRTQAAWIELRQQPAAALQHNMTARVTLTIDRPLACIAAPRSAVVQDGLRNYVFVRKPDGTFERRRVEVGRADDRLVEIRGGLSVGESIATRGVSQLQTAYAAVR